MNNNIAIIIAAVIVAVGLGIVERRVWDRRWWRIGTSGLGYQQVHGIDMLLLFHQVLGGRATNRRHPAPGRDRGGAGRLSEKIPGDKADWNPELAGRRRRHPRRSPTASGTACARPSRRVDSLKLRQVDLAHRPQRVRNRAISKVRRKRIEPRLVVALQVD